MKTSRWRRLRDLSVIDFCRLSSFNKHRGFTLIELLVAIGILAWIMVVAQVMIQTASKAGDIAEFRSQQLKDLDRVWILLETDLRNIVGNFYRPQFGEPLPPLVLTQTEKYVLNFIRAGQANPLLLPRSEVLRVGYRIEDEVLWRDSWIDPYNPIEETARPQQLLENVEELEILALPRPPQGRSIDDGPWLEDWPPSTGGSAAPLPLALEVTLTIKNRGELRRIYMLPPGA